MKLTPRTYAQLWLNQARLTPPRELSHLASRFWQLVWKHRHLNWRRQIMAEVERLWHSEAKIRLVEVAVPKPLTAQAASHLKKELTNQLGQAIELKITVKPHLLAGAVITIGDQRFDASLKGRLDDLYEHLAGVGSNN